MLRKLVPVAIVVAGTALALTALSRDDDAAAPGVVDERAGVLHGVHFGDTDAAIRVRHGNPSDDEDGFFPDGSQYTGPPAIPSPRSDRRPPRPPVPLHYEEIAYLVSPSQGVFSMATLERGARTRAGVAVGDDLSRMRERYDRVTCGEAVAGESLLGGEPPTYPWCRAIVGDTHVFAGGDPVESITLTRLKPAQ